MGIAERAGALGPDPSRIMLLLAVLPALGMAGASAAALDAAGPPSSPTWSSITTFGNHRYRIPVPDGANAAVAFTAELVWRRTGSDANVANGLVLFCADRPGSCNVSFNQSLSNATVLNSSRQSALVAIDARGLPAGVRAVHAYYMPFNRGPNGYGEQVTYLTVEDSPHASPVTMAWRDEAAAAAQSGSLPRAIQSDYESRTPFDAFTELEWTATEAEVAAMVASPTANSMGDVLIFPEPRERQIRMTWRAPYSPTLPELPHRWTTLGPSLALHAGRFDKGEFATFQVGLFAAKSALSSVAVDTAHGPAGFIHSSTGASVTSSALNCFNLDGVDDRGAPFNRSYSVPHLQTGALWFGLDIPTNAETGLYNGTVDIKLSSASGTKLHKLQLSFEISNATAYRSGDGNITRLTRTRWVNSRAGETDVPAKRHVALKIDRLKGTIETWSSLVSLDATGLPKQLTRIGVNTPTRLLSAPFSFAVDRGASCKPLVWDIIGSSPAVASWTAQCATNGVMQTVRGTLDADGTMLYEVNLSSTADVIATLDNVQLQMHFDSAKVPYSMGLGRLGGRIVDWDWRWWYGATESLPTGHGVQNHMIWVGDIDQGMRFKLLGAGNDWLGALHTVGSAADIPSGWGGVATSPSPTPTPVGGQVCGKNCTVYSGGVRVRGSGTENVSIAAYTGAKMTIPKDGLSFKFELLLTPCVRLNTSAHFGIQGRYWQFSCTNPADPNCQPKTGMTAQKFLAAGVKVVNVHQGVPVLNPYINYPFEPVATQPLSDLAAGLHAAGGRMKLYYTTRELSNHAAELWMLRALGSEVLDDGTGPGDHGYRNVHDTSGGASWLQEHMRDRYSVCWSTPSANINKDGMLDAAVCDAQSHDLHQRWSNYYVAGLEWLVSEPPHMDGLYLDGIAYDRTTMKRCRKVMDQAKDGCLIDIHSGNNFSPQYGMVSPALQYMMLMPYMDSTMFGEGYQQGYDRPAGTMQPIDGGGPDWWLIEVSALPFGLMNDMLGNGQRWRGWLFGCVTRLPYPGGSTNVADWALWDRYRLTEADMIGWWEKQREQPVRVVPPADADEVATSACSTTLTRTGHVLATAYVVKGKHTLISVASWSNDTVSCDLEVNWTAIGLVAPATVSVFAIDGFQEAATFAVSNSLRVTNVSIAPAKGWLLVLGDDVAPPTPPPPAPPPGPFAWANISIGGPGSGSSCPLPSASSCLFDPKRCKNLYGGQCGILETEVEEVCGGWAECHGAVCRKGYGGYCLARRHIDTEITVDAWGYRKVPQLGDGSLALV